MSFGDILNIFLEKYSGEKDCVINASFSRAKWVNVVDGAKKVIGCQYVNGEPRLIVRYHHSVSGKSIPFIPTNEDLFATDWLVDELRQPVW